VLCATVITLPFGITVERRASTHELADEICALGRMSRVANLARAVLCPSRCCFL
jgi:hypothetical protein